MATSRSAAESYDALPDTGLLYDHVPAYVARGDVAFYVGEAERAGGAVLGLGSGTGRLLVPIARAGFEITDMYGDFAGEPLTDDAPRMVVRARRAS